MVRICYKPAENKIGGYCIHVQCDETKMHLNVGQIRGNVTIIVLVFLTIAEVKNGITHVRASIKAKKEAAIIILL